MELWLPVITIVGIYILAVMSPGPNFLVITRNALAYSRRTGLQTALGVASGSIVSPETPTAFKLILTLVMTAVSFSWYLLVAAVFSYPGFQSVYGRFQLPANLCFAGLLLYLAVNILVSS